MSTVIPAEHAFASPHLHVIDVRSQADYEAGHWPGAVFLDIKRWESLAKSPESSLHHAKAWEPAIGTLGIDGAQEVLVYDDGRMTEAARAWFILQWYGVAVRVLDGGWPAALRQPGFTPSRQTAQPAPAHYARPAGHQPEVGLTSRDELREALQGPLQILDARTEAEYRGEDLRANARGGHLPGARSVAHSQLLNDDGTLKSAKALQEQLTQAGLDASQPLATHCDAGGRAALAALAAVHAGQQQVSAYYLSFSDWAKDESCPISRAPTVAHFA